jgi:hypothetical protein
MKRDPSSSRKLRSVRNLEIKIGNLAHQLLSTSNYEKSVEIATDLISAIRDLIDERQKPA